MEEVIELAECLRDLVLSLGGEPHEKPSDLIVSNADLNPRPLTVVVPAPYMDLVGDQSGSTLPANTIGR